MCVLMSYSLLADGAGDAARVSPLACSGDRIGSHAGCRIYTPADLLGLRILADAFAIFLAELRQRGKSKRKTA
jgi:hypothetical protein